MAPLSLSLKAAALAFSLFASSSATISVTYPPSNGTVGATGPGIDSIYPVPTCTFTSTTPEAESTSTTPKHSNSAPTATSTSSSYPLLYQPSGGKNGSAYGNPTSKPGYGYGGAGNGSYSFVPMTTSTVYTTDLETITSCAATVTDCPARTVTKIYALYTTVCPVGAQLPTTIPYGNTPADLTSSIAFYTSVPGSGSSPVPNGGGVPGEGSSTSASSGHPAASSKPFTGGAAGKMGGVAVAAVLAMSVGILFL